MCGRQESALNASFLQSLVGISKDLFRLLLFSTHSFSFSLHEDTTGSGDKKTCIRHESKSSSKKGRGGDVRGECHPLSLLVRQNPSTASEQIQENKSKTRVKKLIKSKQRQSKDQMIVKGPDPYKDHHDYRHEEQTSADITFSLLSLYLCLPPKDLSCHTERIVHILFFFHLLSSFPSLLVFDLKDSQANTITEEIRRRGRGFTTKDVNYES